MTDRSDDSILAGVIAARLWQGFTKNEKSLVRLGVFPAEPMYKAEAEMGNSRDCVRLLAVALMDCAKADGGMRA